MKLTTKFMTRNDCYTANRKITPKGLMVHATATPGVMAATWFLRWNKSYKAGEINRQVCVHAFVDNEGAWQYLPWNHRGWHAGGNANNTHIGIEMCEPSGHWYKNGSTMVNYDPEKQAAYFAAVYRNTVELVVMLCKKYGLTEKNVIDHAEGHQLGIASNHADTKHWFPKHGKSMDDFRRDVRVLLAGGRIEESTTEPIGTYTAYTVKNGDTLSKIATLYDDVTWQELAKANRLDNPNLIRVGQELKIPVKPPKKRTRTIQPRPYKVVAGDTLAKIAAKHLYTVGELVHHNGIKNPNVIHVGQVIRFPKKVVKR